MKSAFLRSITTHTLNNERKFYMILKTRRAKNSTRGIYIQDKILQETIFQPGTNYRYVIDQKNRKIIILSSDEAKGNVVSRRQLKNQVKPVIDIRNRAAQDALRNCDYLQVDISGDQIIVQGFMNDESVENATRTTNESGKKIEKRKVTSITDFTSARKRIEVLFSRKSLKKAAGLLGYEQLEMDLFSDEDSQGFSSSGLVHSPLSNLEIPLIIASLFSGGGISDLGAIQAGFDVVYALEKDLDAVKTYRHNIGAHIQHGDITSSSIKSTIPHVPIMIGGSPCQGFSNGNRKTNYLDNPNNLLVKEYITAVQSNPNCKVFVLENVPGILTAGDGQFKDEIYEALSDFEISSGILTSTDYGTPQIRKRAIFIGSKIGKINLPKTTVTTQNHQTVGEAFEGLHSMMNNQLDYSKSKPETLERMSFVPAGGNIFSIPEEIRPKGTHSDMYKRLEWDKPSITIVNPRKAVLMHPEEDRILSVRECARLFDVPDSFEFKGKLSSMQQQIANAVPVKLMKAVMTSVKEAVNRFNAGLQDFSGLKLV